ncbi:GGDEF domain-containing protein [Magnetofaba australis]|uniref:Putative response regulator receiver protein n=1 Tax=Magnetofaba australis IT-1 TaxID=1434232 RepID=A0A1Y2K239_9PROT|nr:diguanylate cyclase [Magnetofaba australis]OSM02022.1 putative response regulator receiver protein [Magnetofaba australis IT-1]
MDSILLVNDSATFNAILTQNLRDRVRGGIGTALDHGSALEMIQSGEWSLVAATFNPKKPDNIALFEALDQAHIPAIALVEELDDGLDATGRYTESLVDFFVYDAPDALERLQSLIERIHWSEQTHVLVAGAATAQRDLIGDLLHARRFVVKQTGVLGGVLDALQTNPNIRLLIVAGMPMEECAALVRSVRNCWSRDELVILALPPMAADMDGVRLLKNGVDEIIRQPICAYSLLAQVDRGLELFEFHQGLKKAATTDRLTGLINRRGFLERAQSLHASAQRQVIGLTTAIVRIVGFDAARMVKGPLFTDLLRKEAAEVIGQAYRRNDVVAQLAPHEFGILLVDMSPEQLPRFIDELTNKLHQRSVVYKGKLTRLRVAIGVSLDLQKSFPQMLDVAERRALAIEEGEDPNQITSPALDDDDQDGATGDAQELTATPTEVPTARAPMPRKR